jgi:CRISPR/Cas system type I-B associated protein Csh2 (Cas7 group RAMP superfamily)
VEDRDTDADADDAEDEEDAEEDARLERLEYLFRSAVGHLKEENGMRLMELMWREHMTRADIDNLLLEYPCHLYICWHS